MPAWFKLHHELRTDKKLKMLAAEIGLPPALARGLWVDLLCFAHELDEEWHLRLDASFPLTDDSIAVELGASEDTCLSFLAAARKYRLVCDDDGCLVITAGEERNQKPSDSPSAVAERQRKYRTTPAGKLRMAFDNAKPTLRPLVFGRDGYECVHCHSTEDLVIDHIVALSNGGTNDPSNLQTLCADCNKTKRREVDIPNHNETPMERAPLTGMERDREEEIRGEKKRKNTSSIGIDGARIDAHVDAPIDDGFDTFWSAYPNKQGKVVARRHWKGMKAHERSAATGVAVLMTKSVEAGYIPREKCPHGSTFLNQRRWEEWEDGTPPGYGPPTPVKSRFEQPAAPKAPSCPTCLIDLTYDEIGAHCSMCGYRPPKGTA